MSATQIFQHDMQSLGLIIHHLNQAGKIIWDSHEEAWPSDPLHHINQRIITVSSALHVIESLLSKQHIKHNTARVIHHLKETKVDYTLLLYLQMPEYIRQKSELISCLQSVCTQMKADFTCGFFYTCVWNYFEYEGVSPITPEKYIIANRKEDILKEYAKIKKSWGKHSPLFLQTYDTKDGKFTNHLYHISRTTQDGIMRLMEILKAGEFVVNGRIYTSCGAFEHVIGPSTLTCQIYDCEIYSTAFDERKTVEEIKEMVQSFPQCISSIMISEDLIDMEDFVKFAVKDRTRRVDEDKVKISFHFIPNICAPKSVHNAATEVCLRECKSRIDAGNAAIKSTGIMPEILIFNGISDSLLAFDYSAIKANGFTTPFSRKKRTDQFSRLIYTEEVCGGIAIGRDVYLKEPQDLESTNLTQKERLMLVYEQLYTTPKREMLCYTKSAMETLASGTNQVCNLLFICFESNDRLASNQFHCFALIGIRTHSPHLGSYHQVDNNVVSHGESRKMGWLQGQPHAPNGLSEIKVPTSSTMYPTSCQHGYRQL
jgi:hypothetical protein